MFARHIWSPCVRRVHSRPLVARWYSWAARLHSPTSQNSDDRVPDQVTVRYHSSTNDPRELKPQTQDRKSQNSFFRNPGEPLDFYEYHLQWPMKPTPLLPCSWVEDLHTIPDGLSKRMQNDPLEILKTSGADPKIVTTCLETFIARSHASAQNDKVAERRIYDESRVPVHALSWLIDSAQEKHDFALHIRLLRAIVHCLVGEGDIDILEEWLLVDHVPSYASTWHKQEQNRWRESAFHYAILSVIYWHDQKTKGLEDGVQFFLQTREKQKRDKIIPCWAACWSLMKILGESAVARTIDAGLFDEFKAVFPRFINRSFQDYILWCSARLMLNHPEGPFPDPTLEIFRDYSRRGLVSKDLPSLSYRPNQEHAGLGYFFINNVKTAQALRDARRDKEARECLDLGRSIAPEYFDGHNPRQIKSRAHAAQWGEKLGDRSHLERLSRRREDILEESRAAKQKRNEIMRDMSQKAMTSRVSST